MKRVSLLAACVLFIACGGGGVDFKNGFPRSETVKLDVPGNASSSLASNTGTNKDELRGDKSSFYALTRGVTSNVNGGVGFVLGLGKAITNHKPTSTTKDTAIWGPHTEDLSPTTWKFTVELIGANDYSYKLEGKPKQDADTSYVTVLTGLHTPALDANGDAVEGFGAGSFTVDWNAQKALADHDPKNEGQFTVKYTRADAASDTTIAVEFKQVKDEETGALVDASYSYLKHAAQGGAFEFAINKNTDAATTQIEHLTIKSRWNPDGAGRADVKATGGDINGQATASECWDQNFTSQYLTASWAPGVAEHNYGTEAMDCAFATAEFSTL